MCASLQNEDQNEWLELGRVGYREVVDGCVRGRNRNTMFTFNACNAQFPGGQPASSPLDFLLLSSLGRFWLAHGRIPDSRGFIPLFR